MADREFEEFRQYFEQLPQHIKAPSKCYMLAHDIALDSPSPEDAPDPPDPPSSGAESHREGPEGQEHVSPCSCGGDGSNSGSGGGSGGMAPLNGDRCCQQQQQQQMVKCCTDTDPCCPQVSPPERVAEIAEACGSPVCSSPRVSMSPICGSPGPRAPLYRTGSSSGPSSVESSKESEAGLDNEELIIEVEMERTSPALPDSQSGSPRPPYPSERPPGERKRRKLPEIPKNKKYDSSSPDSELRLPLNDIDSGNSTQHSPDGAKSMSPQATANASSPASLSPSSPQSPSVPFPPLELLEATHRGLYRFIPRHHDEVEIEIGDPIYVQKEAEDLWCEGVNLRTKCHGIFPAAHVTDVDYSDFDPTVPKVKKERYLLHYLGSIETLSHKGNQVLCQAVRKIARGEDYLAKHPHPCILEVSDQGIRMVDKSKPAPNHVPCHDYFYHLKHVSFCGFHPKDQRYFGFITKHPAVQRFACHVFMSHESTRHVAEAVGRAFQRFYQKFIETAYPIEEFFLE
ncbi:JNK-interacting protein Aplip1 isoform X2 [Oratosquilla oratoria]|uniref:JNK-interacting protein Aplip1 isoform X2 n=1 Tax=Oratosquilla oratoria TaxID=337810 RepID=UPI003F76B37D